MCLTVTLLGQKGYGSQSEVFSDIDTWGERKTRQRDHKQSRTRDPFSGPAKACQQFTSNIV